MRPHTARSFPGLLVALLIAVSSTAFAQPAVFGPAAVYSSAPAPGAAATGDLNHDGRPDLVVANTQSNVISVYLTGAGGTLGAAVTYAVPASPRDVELADVDADGHLDAITANGATLSVLRGTGTGTFLAAQSFPAGPAQDPASAVDAVVADFDGDGRPDIAAAQRGFHDAVSIYFGNGDATFGNQVSYIEGDTGPSNIAAGDLNGDGHPDLVVGLTTVRHIRIYLAQAGRTFAPGNPLLSDINPARAVIADLDSNGTADIAVACSVGTVEVYPGNGNGTVQAYRSFPASGASGCGSATCGAARWLSLADFNGDGRQDAAVANATTAEATVLLGDGAGGFGPPISLPSTNYPSAAVAADFNGDGLPDVALTHGDQPTNTGSRTVAVFLNTTSGEEDMAVVWTNLVNTAVNGATLRKTSGCDGCFDAGAYSQQTIGAGAVGGVGLPFTVAPQLRMVGLSASAAGTSPAALNYALRLSNGVVEIREGGTYRGDFPAAAGDQLSIVVGAGGVVRYLNNDAVVYTSSVVNSAALRAGALFAGAGGEVAGVVLMGSSGPPPPPPPGGANVTWSEGVNVETATGTIRKTSGCEGCFDAAARSTQQISGDGSLEFIVDDPDPVLLAGLTAAFGSGSPSEIDYGIRIQNGWAEVRENALYRADVHVQAGDVFRITVTAGIVTYSHNREVFYTSADPATFPLFAAVTIAEIGASISGVTIG